MKKNKSSNNLKIYLIVGVAILLIAIVIYHYSNIDNSYRKYKIDKSQNIVYTIYEQDKTYVPQINVKGMEEINQNIIDRANIFLQNSENIISYDFDITAKVLSVAIQYVDLSASEPNITYEVYNINFYESTILSNEEILKLYNTDMDTVASIVEAKFKEFYVDLYQKKYFDEECNYDCFLYMRGIQDYDYLKESYFYIRNGNLYVLNPFKIYSPFNEEDYFSLEDHYIQITE